LQALLSFTEKKMPRPGNKPKKKSNTGKTRVYMRTRLHDIPEELDLHGYRVEESLDLVDDYLDRAFIYGISPVRIVHGHGTGKLRNAIREYLSRHPHVHHFVPGGEYSGGEGVTVVFLKATPILR
jgi:DNA mismatch repair protein MutS2